MRGKAQPQVEAAMDKGADVLEGAVTTTLAGRHDLVRSGMAGWHARDQAGTK